MSLTCRDLAERIEQMQPAASPQEVARLCLLLTNYSDNLDDLADEERLEAAWRQMGAPSGHQRSARRHDGRVG